MGEKTDIRWTHHTFNPFWGCMKVSPGCTNCYADTLSTRWGFDIWGPAQTTQRRTFGEKHWNEPRLWNKKAEQAGERRRVFCASMADVFEEHPQLVAERAKLWPLIEETPWLDWLLLTKRPENIHTMMPVRWLDTFHFPKNIWVGTSVETQEYAEKRIPWLLDIPARIHFLSCEPLLGPLDLWKWLPLLEWVICGGESGAKHRMMDLDWARGIRDQCHITQVPFFMKQVGGLTHASGGHLLDGVEYYQFPELKQK